MAPPNQQPDHSQARSPKTLKREFFFPEGYEMAFVTLRSLFDGKLYSYQPLNTSATPVQAIPIAVQLSGIELLGNPQQVQHMSHSGTGSSSLSLPPSSDNSPYPSQTLNQQIDIMAPPHNNARELSVSTLRRHAHERDDEYTDVCGVPSPAISTPVRKYNHGKGVFCCPRCGSNFTRPKSVKDHFPSCISKCGNPQALRFTDHPSMAQTEAAIKRRARGSPEASSALMEGDEAQMDGHSQGFGFEEMSEALARTSLRVPREHVVAHGGTYIKTESMFDADVPRESIETPSPERLLEPYSSQTGHPFPQSSSSRGQVYVAQTPDWQNPRLDSSTSTPHNNPWNIGVPGSAAEHAKMDMRATAPFDGWLHEPQTPGPTNHNGIQNDGLDGFMDRRSHVSPTPAASHPSERFGTLYEESEMEE